MFSPPSFHRGTFRVLLVLLHGFPECLCDYHCGFCDVIPPKCIPIHNLKVVTLPDISIAPRTVASYVTLIKQNMIYAGEDFKDVFEPIILS